MTKKEQQALRDDLIKARAHRFTEPVKPRRELKGWINPREIATVTAALGMWKRLRSIATFDEAAIATDGTTLLALTDDEVTVLAAKISKP